MLFYLQVAGPTEHVLCQMLLGQTLNEADTCKIFLPRRSDRGSHHANTFCTCVFWMCNFFRRHLVGKANARSSTEVTTCDPRHAQQSPAKLAQGIGAASLTPCHRTYLSAGFVLSNTTSCLENLKLPIQAIYHYFW